MPPPDNTPLTYPCEPLSREGAGAGTGPLGLLRAQACPRPRAYRTATIRQQHLGHASLASPILATNALPRRAAESSCAGRLRDAAPRTRPIRAEVLA